jgi:hypothetical protein
MRCVNNFLICLIDYICRSMLDTFFYLHLFTVQTLRRRLKQEGVYVTSHTTDHTYIDLFFEDTCAQVIWLWYVMISF